MPFDGSGNFNRNFPPGGWQGDATANIKILADRHDQHDKDLADGLTNCLTKDGQTQPTANIPMNGKRITNLADPTDPSDAATKKFVENVTGWTTSKTISGADLNGRLIFSGTGITGLQWTVADLSWLAKAAEAGKTVNRLVLNDKGDGTGTDVFVIDENGFINDGGWLLHNTSYDGQWRTISPGTSTAFNHGNGTFAFYSNDTATASAWQVSGIRNFASLQNGAGSVTFTMTMNGNGKTNHIVSTNASVMRWLMQLGNGVSETGGNAGSDFAILRYGDTGAYLGLGMSITRSTGAASFGGTVTAPTITSSGQVTSSQDFVSSSANVILAASGAAGGALYLRPQGPAAGGGQWYIPGANGTLQAGTATSCGIMAGQGYKTHGPATTGGYGSNWFNIQYASPNVQVWIDNSNLGNIAWQCDYRMKRDITPLPSMWDKVKALSPIQYRIRDWSIFTDDDTPRWGFVAHELQEKLIETAASGHKDEENVVQGPNLLALIAALTKALQEAMTRIEALEAAA